MRKCPSQIVRKVDGPKIHSCGCCQTNSNQSQFAAETANLCGTKLTPLGNCGAACQLEGVSAGERSFLVETVVDRGMDGGEFLQTSHAPETLHGPLSSSEWKVRVLNAVVEPSARPLFFERTQFSERCLLESEAIGDDFLGTAMPLHQFLEEFQCCSFVPTFRDDGFEHFTFVIDRTPKIVTLAIHLHENFVYVPLPFRERTKLLHALFSDLSSEHWTEPVPPVADSFVAFVDAALMQQIFDIPKREREPDIKHDRQADHFRAGFEVLEGGRFGHRQTLRNHPAPLKQSYSDKTQTKDFFNAILNLADD